jgi:hypothetical protein
MEITCGINVESEKMLQDIRSIAHVLAVEFK